MPGLPMECTRSLWLGLSLANLERRRVRRQRRLFGKLMIRQSRVGSFAMTRPLMPNLLSRSEYFCFSEISCPLVELRKQWLPPQCLGLHGNS